METHSLRLDQLAARRVWNDGTITIGQFTADAINRQIKSIGKRCGYKLANDGHDTRSIQAWLGHANINHTVRYTELSAARFKDFWRATKRGAECGTMER
jgi:integrase